ncbi:hypothetical protein [Nocardia carnea]|uniref:hypothetical protein n=1 Tax=Nocardia carnea TaxID=37328 RepID=UPI002453E08C|nr:hypothetical protein [Nocardia carnea]
MTIHITDWQMTSGISLEFAERVQTRHGSSWLLSWLPGRALSFEQAYAAMELDEILSDPELVYDDAALSWARQQAELLGLVFEQVVVLLAGRVEARLAEARIMQDVPTGYRDDPGAIRSGSAA